MKKLKVKCTSCNDWGVIKEKNKQGVYIDINCPKDCGGDRRSTDPWEYSEVSER